MSENLYRPFFEAAHFEKNVLASGLLNKYENCQYKIIVYLSSIGKPKYDRIWLKNSLKGNTNPELIKYQDPDIKKKQKYNGIGYVPFCNFIFLLSAKMKYDSLQTKSTFAKTNPVFYVHKRLKNFSQNIN
jgi:hypothetical protein